MRYIPGSPKDYISELIKTSGGEWMTLDGVEYKGYYHKIGYKYFTGVEENDFSEELITYNSDPNYVEYVNLHNFYLLNEYNDPIVYYPILKDIHYKKGVFSRYFIKKRNDEFYRIIEINDTQFAALNRGDSGINEKYYFGIKLEWKINGPKNDVYKNNNIVIYGVEDTNRRTLNLKEAQMKGIKSTLRDLTQYARLS